MKMLWKRLLVAVLLVAMVAPMVPNDGNVEQKVWASDEMNTDLLNVKVQTATDDSKIMRFIASVDSLDYQNVGFEVTPKGEETKTHIATKVFERIQSVESSVSYAFSPKVVSVDAEYFVTAKMYAQDGVDYMVRAFATTLEGNVVYGTSRCVSLEDGTSTTTLNLSFEAKTEALASGLKEGDVLKANDTQAQVIGVDDQTVHVRVTVNPNTLPSATNFVFTSQDGTTEIGSVVYRNLYTAYKGTADRTWFDVYPAATTDYMIASSADLYGLAEIVNGGNPLNNKKIYVVSDIHVNTGTATLSETDGWSGNDSPYAWTPIGTNAGNKRFNGTFDGQGHTISGLYFVGTTQNTGLFGCTYTSAKLKNFILSNSYFSTTINNAWIGSVAGILYGEASNIKSTAIVKGTGSVVGGMFGGTSTIGSSIVRNCWFDGTLELGTTAAQAGGILAKVYATPGSSIVLEGCLQTGTISNGKQQFGGIVGFVQASGSGTDITLEIKDSLVTKSFACTATAVGAIVGDIYSTSGVKVDLQNTYAVGDENTKINGRNRAGATALVQSGTGVVSETNAKGTAAWYNTTLDFGAYYVAMSDASPQLQTFATETTIATLGGRGTSEEPWIIETAEELKVLASLAESTYNFHGKHVKLANDITVVEGDTVDAVKNNANASWDPIGSVSLPFAGTFDGNGKTISGIYYMGTGTYIGLFGALSNDATVKGLTLATSYFEYTGASSTNVSIGSIAGAGAGTIKEVKSSATVVCGAKRSGGFFGGITGTALVSDCWFDGTLSLGSTGIQGGGFVGLAETDSNTVFEHCLNSGTLSGSYTGGALMLGGFVGNVYNSTVTIRDSLSVGKINATQTWRGSMIGRLQGNTSTGVGVVNISNSYFNNEDGCEARFNGVRNQNGTCAAFPTGLTMEQLRGENATTNAADLSFTDKGEGVHWVTGETYPTLRVFTQ